MNALASFAYANLCFYLAVRRVEGMILIKIPSGDGNYFLGYRQHHGFTFQLLIKNWF